MKKRKQEPLTRESPPQPPPVRQSLSWVCQACRWSLTTKEAAPRCPKCGVALSPPPDTPRPFRADLCDECHAPLPQGHRLAGLCPRCLDALEPTLQGKARQQSPV